MTRRSRLATRPRLEVLDQRCVLSALTPTQIDSAYGLNAISYKGLNGTTIKGDGTGQTIAVVDAYNDPNLASDVATFDSYYNLPKANLGLVNQAGGLTDAGWSQETALDVEWLHAAAPGANIVVVEAASASTNDLLTAVNTARNIPGVSVVSMSWGGSEFAGETAYDSFFTTPAGHTGVTFIAAAGDSGAGAQWPASSPNVVAVGGTSLHLISTTGANTQSAWSGSGGGLSLVEPEPAYQVSVQTTGRRSAVDVALDADPNTGVLVYAASAGGWAQVGGTSLSSPLFAGLIALADEGRALTGQGTLDGPTQTLPLLYAAPAGSFTDVTTGSRATLGYDTSTGLGAPNGAVLVNYLAGGTTSTTGGTTTGGTTTTTGNNGSAPIANPGNGTTGGTTTPTPPAPTHHRRPSQGIFTTQAPTGVSSFGGPSGVWTIFDFIAEEEAPVPTSTLFNPRGHLGEIEAVDAILARWERF